MSFYKINVTLDLNSHEVLLSKVKIGDIKNVIVSVESALPFQITFKVTPEINNL